MAFIAAYHIVNNQKSCSLQVITDDTSWNAEYLFTEFTMEENGVRIGPNVLTRQDCHLDLKREGLEVQADLSFGEFESIVYDIMGLLPICSVHGVPSQRLQHEAPGGWKSDGQRQEICLSDGV